MRLPYIFKISGVLRVVDGDTAHLELALGFHASLVVTIRLLGYDTPEKNKGSLHERNQSKIAQAVTERFLGQPTGQLWVRTEVDPDNFGRYLGDIWQEAADGTESHLGALLERRGLATVWPTRWFEVYDPGGRA